MRNYYFLLFGFCLSAFCQPVLTSADFDQDVHYVAHTSDFYNVSGFLPTSAVFSNPKEVTNYQNSISIPVSSVPNATNFAVATSAIRYTDDSGKVFYTLFETTDLLHRAIATGDDNSITPINETKYIFPFQLNDVCAYGKYETYVNVNTPYGNYSNVIRLHSEEIFADYSHKDVYTFITINPYKVIAEAYIYGGNGGSAAWGVVYEYLPYVLSNEKFEMNSFSIFPNPTISDITIIRQNNLNVESFASVYDVLGKALITKQKLKGDHLNITLKDFSSGLYIVKITNKENQVLQTKKIIKN